MRICVGLLSIAAALASLGLADGQAAAASTTVPINVSDNAQSVVDANPPGTTFLIQAGTHSGFSVVPKTGDVFDAQPGAVLDGGGVTSDAFDAFGEHRQADDVTVAGASVQSRLLITNYTDGTSPVGRTIATSQGDLFANGWILDALEIANNTSEGIGISNTMVVEYCYIHDNGRLGIGGGGTGGSITDNVIDHNAYDYSSAVEEEAGGIKVEGTNLSISDNDIESNNAPGIWTDLGATGITITGNIVEANRIGVHVEISHNVDITNNTIEDNSGPGVRISGSNNVNVEDNVITGSAGGVLIDEYNRGSGPEGARVVQDVAVEGNTIENSGITGIATGLPAGTVITFNFDQYGTGDTFEWNGSHTASFLKFQQLSGQEPDGSYQSSAT